MRTYTSQWREPENIVEDNETKSEKVSCWPWQGLSIRTNRKNMLPEYDLISKMPIFKVLNIPSRKRTVLKAVESPSDIACRTCRAVLKSVTKSAIVADVIPHTAMAIFTTNTNSSTVTRGIVLRTSE